MIYSVFSIKLPSKSLEITVLPLKANGILEIFLIKNTFVKVENLAISHHIKNRESGLLFQFTRDFQQQKTPVSFDFSHFYHL